MTDNKKLGTYGEELAAAFLQREGYFVIHRNYTCPYGEVDIIAVKDNKVAFVEVKTRTSQLYGEGTEAVNGRKQRHIKNAASYFLSHCRRKYEAFDFQVIEIKLTHIDGLAF